jgi:hypothetical protein
MPMVMQLQYLAYIKSGDYDISEQGLDGDGQSYYACLERFIPDFKSLEGRCKNNFISLEIILQIQIQHLLQLHQRLLDHLQSHTSTTKVDTQS